MMICVSCARIDTEDETSVMGLTRMASWIPSPTYHVRFPRDIPNSSVTVKAPPMAFPTLLRLDIHTGIAFLAESICHQPPV